MSKQIELRLFIGHTHSTEKIYYSSRQVKDLLANSYLPCTILSGEGTEGSPHPFEDTSVIEINWQETTHGKLELFCTRLSDFLGKVADVMHQRWVLLRGFVFDGGSIYRVYIQLNLQECRSIEPDDLLCQQMVFSAINTYSYPDKLHQSRTFLARLVDVFWREPGDTEVITAALRDLYQTLFGTELGHRITFLAPRTPYSRYLRPRYRYAYGSGTRLQSKARFARNSALAGLAWESPGRVFLKEIPDFTGNEAGFAEFIQREFRLSPKDVNRFSAASRRTCWIFCFGIVHPASGEFIGVISIDSRSKDALSRIDTGNIMQAAKSIANVVGSPSV